MDGEFNPATLAPWVIGAIALVRGAEMNGPRNDGFSWVNNESEVRPVGKTMHSGGKRKDARKGGGKKGY